MFSSGTSSPVSADTFLSLMRLIVPSSNWLNETLFLLTAWNILMGIATSPKLIVPLHTGLGMPPVCRENGHLTRRRLTGEHRPCDQIGAERSEDREVQQPGGRHDGRVIALSQRRLGHQDEHDRG